MADEEIAMLGMECVLSIAGGEVKNVQDVTVTLSAGEADVTTRGNQGWRQTVPTLRECTIEFTMLYLPSDATFGALLCATARYNLFYPADDDPDQIVAITAEPIYSGRVGRVWLGGVIGASVNVSDESHKYVDCDSSGLYSADSGPFRLVAHIDSFAFILPVSGSGGHLVGSTQSALKDPCPLFVGLEYYSSQTLMDRYVYVCS